jgi:sigma-B regulation protein RsbU (phosphoserine phosphatase)
MTSNNNGNLELEIENAARELAERYEEINLLYSISEILGRTVSLDEAASTILREVSETVGARRASIFVCEPGETVLRPIAVRGVTLSSLPPVPIDDPDAVAARVFRARHPLVIDPTDTSLNDGFRQGALLAVPITWTEVDGRADLLGVVILTDRRPVQPFSAGDVKLMVAIATQIGSAIQNARLVRAVIAQQRLAQEMELAHDLQMRLLPSATIVAPQACVAARVLPAESVAGDFYYLYKLTPTATGVMIGDVSSHGYRAALIMALAISAASIHAQSTLDPGAMLHALLDSLRSELTSTEMFITVFYGVIDQQAGLVHYANTGHPHAFVVRANGTMERLKAIDPPLGMVEAAPGVRTTPWNPKEDLLVLFTDGVPDARNAADARLGEERVLDTLLQHRHEAPDQIIEHIFEVVRQHTGDTALRDDLTVLVLRN